jgi:protoporphyrinogen oxidase
MRTSAAVRTFVYKPTREVLNNRPLQVDIIGAGISGLASAWWLTKAAELQNRDLNIRIWEADTQAGGLAGTFDTGDFVAEKFYHHLFKRDTELIDLASELGLGDKLEWRAASTGAYYFGQPWRLSSPWDLLRFRPLLFWDRIRMGLMVLSARGMRDWAKLDEISAADYIRQTAGERVYQVVWQPLLRGKFGTDAEKVSAAWLWSKFADRGSSRGKDGGEVLGYFRGGMGQVFETLVRKMEAQGHSVHFGQRVDGIELDATGQATGVVVAGTVFSTDLIVAGCHTPQLLNLLPKSHSESLDAYREQLSGIRYLANICLVLAIEKPLSAFYWTNVTDPEAPFVGIVEQTRWTGTDAYGGQHLAYISAYVPQDDPRLHMEAETLFAHYLPHIRKLFPAFRAEDVRAKYAWQAPYTQPIVTTGYLKRIPDVRTPMPNVYFCTMAQIYPHDRQVANGVAMARKTVTALADDGWLSPPL